MKTRLVCAVCFTLALIGSAASAAPGGMGNAPASTGQDSAAQGMMEQNRDQAQDSATDRWQEQERTMQESRDREQMAEQGANTSAEMQKRRDEQKEMKSAYKESDTKVTGKKPWWKFWESGDDEEDDGDEE